MVPVLCDVAFQHFTFVIKRPPKGMRLAVDLYENLVQGPSPIRVRTHLLDTFTTESRCEHWAKSIPPVPRRFVADVDAALVQQVLDIAKRKGKTNVHHDRQADDLGAAVKALEKVSIFVMNKGYETTLPASSRFVLTMPLSRKLTLRGTNLPYN